MLPRRVLEDLPHTFSLALRTTPDNHAKAYEIMDLFHYPSVLVSLERTAGNIRQVMARTGSAHKKVHIIDPLSRVIGSYLNPKQTTHVPYNLGHIMEAVEKKVQEFPMRERLVIMDGVHALSLVYDAETIKAFLKYSDARLKMHHAKVVYTYHLDKLGEEMKEVIDRLADKVVEIP